MKDFGGPTLGGARPPGVYHVEENVEEARRLAQEQSFSFFYVDGEVVRDKASFLSEAASTMRFPEWFGGNWDAFEDCITDLFWDAANGYVLFFDGPKLFARLNPSQWQTARSILESAVEYWKGEGKPFYVLLKGMTNQET